MTNDELGNSTDVKQSTSKIKQRREHKARLQWEAEHDWHAEQSANETKTAFEVYLASQKKKITDIIIHGYHCCGLTTTSTHCTHTLGTPCSSQGRQRH